jgi:hypothetical protein
MICRNNFKNPVHLYPGVVRRDVMWWLVNRVTGANCFHVQGDGGQNGTHFTNRRNDAEVIRYDSSQVEPITHAPVFNLFL